MVDTTTEFSNINNICNKGCVITTYLEFSSLIIIKINNQDLCKNKNNFCLIFLDFIE